jgi:amino acid adenylation domain-containing protein
MAGGVRPSRPPRRLSFPQERLVLLDRLMPGMPAYHVPSLVRVRAHLDEALLRSAAELIVQRHEILRTRFFLRDGELLSEVADGAEVEFQVLDLNDPSPAERRQTALGELGALAARPFELGSDTLVRFALAHVDQDEDLLLVVLNHLASDHASTRILFGDLEEIYGALLKDTTPQLPDLPVQYADFAESQREQLTGDRLEELLGYWTRELGGAPGRLELPTDHARPTVPTHGGRRLPFVVNADLAAGVSRRAREHRATPFMFLLTAFQALMHRYSGADDLVVGVPVSGRRQADFAHLLGYFSNTLAIRGRLDGDPTFAELLERVRRSTIGAQVHGELPFEKLVEVLNPPRSQAVPPVFQVVFGFDVAEARQARLAGTELEFLEIPGWGWSRFDLSMTVRETSDGLLRGVVEFSTDLFEEATVERLVGHYRELIASATAEPSRPVSELGLLTSAERELMLDRWNRTDGATASDALHDLVTAQASRQEDAVAVAAGERWLSYHELDFRSNQLARELIARGVGAGALVAICLERSPELLVAMLGILKTGAAYVPLDASYPPDRLEFMLRDSAAVLFVCDEPGSGLVRPGTIPMLCIEGRDAEERISGHDGSSVNVTVDLEQPAYVIYTSGSTGTPKGVKVSHRSVVNLLAHMRQEPGCTENDVVVNLTTPAFDLSVPDWYLPLTTGAKLVLAPRSATFDGVELGGWLARSGATLVQATPTTWQVLLESGWQGRSGLKIVCGGEAVPRALVEQLLPRSAAVWHMYGPTETTVWSSTLRLDADAGGVPLGGPIRNTSFFVLDPHGQPTPIGVPGELHIGGDGLALGYHGRPDLTAEKFIVGPPATGGRRLYRTGDLVRWRESGTLEYLGRIDEQVKLRGFRIELGEIAAVLELHPTVVAAVAVVREDRPGDRRLVAYVVRHGGAPLPADALLTVCRQKLAPYMVPSAIVELERFPVNPNGKLDRSALPAPEGSGASPERPYVAPRTPVEEAIAEIWCEVLGVQRLGVEDNFFDLGGHSLLALKMLARLQNSFGVEIELAAAFDLPTVAELGRAVTAELVAGVSDEELSGLLTEL